MRISFQASCVPIRLAQSIKKGSREKLSWKKRASVWRARRLRVKDQHSTFYFFPLASISFSVSLLFHPPKWEVRGCEWSVNTAKRSDETLRVPLWVGNKQKGQKSASIRLVKLKRVVGFRYYLMLSSVFLSCLRSIINVLFLVSLVVLDVFGPFGSWQILPRHGLREVSKQPCPNKSRVLNSKLPLGPFSSVQFFFSFSLLLLFFFSANRQQRQLRWHFITHKLNARHNVNGWIKCAALARSRWISCDVANIELTRWLLTLMASFWFWMTVSRDEETKIWRKHQMISRTPTLTLAKLYLCNFSTSTFYHSHVMLRYLYRYRLTKLVSSLANQQMANIQKMYFTLRRKPEKKEEPANEQNSVYF